MKKADQRVYFFKNNADFDRVFGFIAMHATTKEKAHAYYKISVPPFAGTHMNALAWLL